MSLPADLAAAIARAGVNPTLPERHLEDALCAEIADRRGYRGDWWVGDDGLWHVELLALVRDECGGATHYGVLVAIGDAWAMPGTCDDAVGVADAPAPGSGLRNRRKTRRPINSESTMNP
jgi:hypothetical protein